MMIAKPRVASARNTPETRIAGMAMMAPIGTATNEATTSATSQGHP